MIKSIVYSRYREILFQKAASGYLLHFVQNGSSKNVRMFCPAPGGVAGATGGGAAPAMGCRLIGPFKGGEGGLVGSLAIYLAFLDLG